MKTTNKATTVWEGSGKKGKGTFGTPSGVLDAAAISFGKRFEGEKGTNPEELIAAAHSGCFSMALAVQRHSLRPHPPGQGARHRP